MRVLVTGGAGFIGRWVIKRLLDNNEVIALDNLYNGSMRNILEFLGNYDFKFVKGDILDVDLVNRMFKNIDVCIHLAAQINVQDSINNPEKTFKVNVVGTYNILNACKENDVKLVIVGTCLVYDHAYKIPIDEKHPTKPSSPYTASKLAAEEMAISYYHSFGVPVVITRPFNTYGPYQKSDMEGGVISIFIKRYLQNLDLLVYGDGKQTRDFLYVEDCADFITKASFGEEAVGEVINAGSGKDISINDLAYMICKDKQKIRHVLHHHPQSEVQKLLCDYSKAEKLLGWKPKTYLEEGIRMTMNWMKDLM